MGVSEALHPSVLRVDPAIVKVVRVLGVSVRLGTFSARLTTVVGMPIPGQVVSFTSLGRPLCSATTDANGRATCSTGLSGFLAAAVALGVSAAYDGPQYLPSKGHAGLIG